MDDFSKFSMGITGVEDSLGLGFLGIMFSHLFLHTCLNSHTVHMCLTVAARDPDSLIPSTRPIPIFYSVTLSVSSLMVTPLLQDVLGALFSFAVCYQLKSNRS